MNDEKKYAGFSDEELKSEFATSKKLFYPAVVILLIIFALGIYNATKVGMGLFKIALFCGACFICMKYIVKHNNLQKEMKSRNLF